jgi:hypothetical protein
LDSHDKPYGNIFLHFDTDGFEHSYTNTLGHSHFVPHIIEHPV